jgi:lipoprotein signal peptidase
MKRITKSSVFKADLTMRIDKFKDLVKMTRSTNNGTSFTLIRQNQCQLKDSVKIGECGLIDLSILSLNMSPTLLTELDLQNVMRP